MPRSKSGERPIEAFHDGADSRRMAAGVAHEINNPLAYILGGVELLERAFSELLALHPQTAATQPIISNALSAIANAKDGVERIRRITLELASYARTTPDSPLPIDVEAAIDAALSLTPADIEPRLRVVKCLTPVPAVLGNEGQLAQLFVNLFLSVAQAVPFGRQSLLRISTASEGEQVIVIVEDDGRRFDHADMSRVPEQPCAGEGSPGGSGFGLDSCRKIVTALGGTITVMSVPEAGTRFTVSLLAAGSAEVPGVGNRARRRDRVKSRARILIIDDEPLLGQTLRFAFQDKHDVEVVASGRDALERLAQDSAFDLVLCDLMMPDVSGEHVYKAVAEHSPGLLPRFVFMTGGAFTERSQEFLARFQGRQLEKPFNINEVETLISEVFAAGAA